MPVVTLTQRLFLGRYQLVRQLGEGGMARVFLAVDQTNNHEVVVKVMHDHLIKNPTVRQHFGREFDLMKRFRHPGAVAWLDGSIDAAEPCLVMEYVRGINLDEYTQHKHPRVGPARVGAWLGQICQVLHAAHQADILHRDLSLANLMLVGVDTKQETIKVLDFGLARLSGSMYLPIEKLTGNGQGMGGGTPDYVCPEQIRGDAVDARGDIYSLGVILFRLLTGKFPFQQFEQPADLLLAHVHLAPPTFAKAGAPDVNPAVEKAVQQCLSKFPAERPASAKQLADLFGKALGYPIAPRDGFPDKAPETVRTPLPYNPRYLVDAFDAFMPEQVAVVKLRGFIAEMGGAAIDSEPGHIRVRLPDPRDKRPVDQNNFSWFGLKKRPPMPEPKSLHLDLYMTKRQVAQRSLVEIAVVLPPSTTVSLVDIDADHGFAARICRELRAYLMIGR
jgi:serine/threonine protein kinase